MASCVRRSKLCAAFTLIELAIVVGIIGMLAAIALPRFMAYQLRSKTAEAKTNLGAIVVTEEAYFSELAQYVAAGPEPAAVPGPGAVAFNPAASNFAQLGFAPEGRVYFSYGVLVSADGAGYTADAAADIDGDGIVQFWGYAKPDDAGVLAPGQVGCNVAALSPVALGPCHPAAGLSIF